jgi:hypothetical protein
LNQTQLVSNIILRSIITFEDTKKSHFFISQSQPDEDKLFLVSEPVKYLSEMQHAIPANKKATPGFNEGQAKVDLMAKICESLNDHEIQF